MVCRSGDVSVAKPLVLEPRASKLYSGSPSINAAPQSPRGWAFWIQTPSQLTEARTGVVEHPGATGRPAT